MDWVYFSDIVKTIKNLGERKGLFNKHLYEYEIDEYKIILDTKNDRSLISLFKDEEIITEIDELYLYTRDKFVDICNSTFRKNGTIADVVDIYVKEKESREKIKLENKKREQEKLEMLKKFMK